MNTPGLSAETKFGMGCTEINSRCLYDYILLDEIQPIREKFPKYETLTCDTGVHNWEEIQKDHPLGEIQKDHRLERIKIIVNPCRILR